MLQADSRWRRILQPNLQMSVRNSSIIAWVTAPGNLANQAGAPRRISQLSQSSFSLFLSQPRKRP